MDILFQQELRVISTEYLPFLASLVTREFAKVAVARAYGDRSHQDRLTLNPGAHLDMIGTVFFPLIMVLTGKFFIFGWARPLILQSSGFKRRRLALCSVALVGSLTHLVLALVFAGLVIAISSGLSHEFYFYASFLEMAWRAVSINLLLSLINLLPMPPLDGHWALMAFMSPTKSVRFAQASSLGAFILVVFMMSPIGGFLKLLTVIIGEMLPEQMSLIFHLPTPQGSLMDMFGVK